MTDPAKSAKFIERLQDLVSRLEGQHDLLVHQNINQFYYMQKSEELKVLLEQFEEAQRKQEMLSRWIEVNYTETFHKWRKDVRWLNMYLRCEQQAKS